MHKVCFTPNLLKLIDVTEYQVAGDSVQAALEAVFKEQPQLKSYVMDEQNRIRKHINVFVDGEMLFGNQVLAQSLNENAEIYVMQALSGG